MQDDMPETLHEAIRFFSQGDNALRIMVAKRWPNGVVCPHCQTSNVLFMVKASKWQCRDCRKQFTIKTGTIFEDSPIKLDKWLSALWLITNAKNGISSCELHRSLGVTQKTAWFMLHRIRLAMQSGTFEKMSGNVEVDETFIGGKARNMHKGQRKAKGTGPVAMTPVMGLLERTTERRASQVRLHVVETTRKPELQGHVRNYVLKGSEIHTDALKSYSGLCDEYTHNVIDHAVSYVNGNVHTNGLENFWSLLKRTVKGTYVSVEPFHLFRYLDEQSFRFNERKQDGKEKTWDLQRFQLVLGGVFGKRVTYKKLTGKLDKPGKELLP